MKNKLLNDESLIALIEWLGHTWLVQEADSEWNTPLMYAAKRWNIQLYTLIIHKILSQWKDISIKWLFESIISCWDKEAIKRMLNELNYTIRKAWEDVEPHSFSRTPLYKMLSKKYEDDLDWIDLLYMYWYISLWDHYEEKFEDRQRTYRWLRIQAKFKAMIKHPCSNSNTFERIWKKSQEIYSVTIKEKEIIEQSKLKEFMPHDNKAIKKKKSCCLLPIWEQKKRLYYDNYYQTGWEHLWVKNMIVHLIESWSSEKLAYFMEWCHYNTYAYRETYAYNHKKSSDRYELFYDKISEIDHIFLLWEEYHTEKLKMIEILVKHYQKTRKITNDQIYHIIWIIFWLWSRYENIKKYDINDPQKMDLLMTFLNALDENALSEWLYGIEIWWVIKIISDRAKKRLSKNKYNKLFSWLKE